MVGIIILDKFISPERFYPLRTLLNPANNQRDGAMQYAPYDGRTVNYEPNTLANRTPSEAPATAMAQTPIEGKIQRQKII